MNGRIVKIRSMIVIGSLTLCLLLCGHKEVETETASAVIGECVLYAGETDREAEVALKIRLQGGDEFWIDGWEKDGTERLFLPSVLRETEVSFGAEQLFLQEGKQIIRTEQGKELMVEVLFGSHIPFACLSTESGNLEFLQESKLHQETGELYFIGADGTVEYAGALTKVKIRGNATRMQPKSPFRIRLQNGASLAGLGNSKDYVLLAEYGDISLMRNKAAMELANRTTERYEPDGAYMDLYVNGTYMGVYVLCEGVMIGENRLDITDLEKETEQLNKQILESYGTFQVQSERGTLEKGYEIPENPKDITGGYLLELEYDGRYETDETTGFRTDHGRTLVIKEPAFASREQVEYIQEQFQHVEDAMYGPDYCVPEDGSELYEVVDLESLVHKYLVDEICMNTDLWTSQFLYKDQGDEKFYFGPMWDYDMAFGHYDTGFSAEEFYAREHIWYGEVYDYDAFRAVLREEYENHCLPVLQDLTGTKLQEWKGLLQDSAHMNFLRWDIHEIYERNSIIHTGDSFEECVDFLEIYIKERTEFLSSEWLENP